MAYLDTDYVDNAIGADVRAKVAPGDSFAQFELMARAWVQAACKMAGYDLTDTDTGAHEQLRQLALGRFVALAYGLQKGLEIPPAISDQIHLLELIRSGQAPLLDYTPNTRDAVGGVKYSSTDQTTGRARRLSRSELKDW